MVKTYIAHIDSGNPTTTVINEAYLVEDYSQQEVRLNKALKRANKPFKGGVEVLSNKMLKKDPSRHYNTLIVFNN